MLGSALTIAVLELRQILYGKKALATAVLVAGAVALGFVVGRYGIAPPQEGWPLIYLMMMSFLFLHTLVILIPLQFTTSLIREETDAGTLLYLFTRPVPKAVILLAKFTTAVSVSTLFVVGGMGLFHLAFLIGRGGNLGDHHWGHSFLGFVQAGTLGVLGYGAIFTFVGLFTKRALVFGIAYGFLSEFILATVPAVVREITLMHYLR
ncbi:MAG: ABC transporter permease, partial [Planctomycetota bacterium]